MPVTVIQAGKGVEEPAAVPLQLALKVSLLKSIPSSSDLDATLIPIVWLSFVEILYS